MFSVTTLSISYKLYAEMVDFKEDIRNIIGEMLYQISVVCC